MFNRKNNLQIQTVIIVGFITIGYMLFNLAISVYNDYQVNLRLEQYAEENERIARDNLNKKEEYAYFNSDLFKDKYAKENLNKLQPGEKVIVLPEKTENIFAERPLFEEDELKVERLMLLSNREQWKEYFFGEERI